MVTGYKAIAKKKQICRNIKIEITRQGKMKLKMFLTPYLLVPVDIDLQDHPLRPIWSHVTRSGKRCSRRIAFAANETNLK